MCEFAQQKAVMSCYVRLVITRYLVVAREVSDRGARTDSFDGLTRPPSHALIRSLKNCSMLIMNYIFADGDLYEIAFTGRRESSSIIRSNELDLS